MLRFLLVFQGCNIQTVAPDGGVNIDPTGLHGRTGFFRPPTGRMDVTGFAEATRPGPHPKGLVKPQQKGLPFQEIDQITDPEALIRLNQKGLLIFPQESGRFCPGRGMGRTGMGAAEILTTVPALPHDPGSRNHRGCRNQNGMVGTVLPCLFDETGHPIRLLP